MKSERTGENAGLDMNLQDVMDGVEDKLFVIDSEYRVNFTNLAMRQSLPEGRPLTGKHCYEVFEGRNTPCSSPVWKCPLTKVLQSGSPTTIISPDHTLSGETVSNRYIKVTLYPLRDSQGNINAFAELRKDVSAERELESQILKRHHHLHALNRISSATSGLWDLDAILNIALDTVLEIIGATTGGILLLHEKQLREHSITISTSFETDLGKVYASKNQLRQVFLNMVSNARDAMPDGGTLTVETRHQGGKIFIEITDTGIGIKKENVKKVFDTFFTTKDSVKGVGLGLSVCYGFIKEHGGDILVESDVNSGTTFTVILPVYEEST